MFGFPLDIWDYLTFWTFFILAVGALFLIAFIGGLPGRIAIARKHPEAEAVQLLGWVGLLPVLPWLQALVWSIKPTNVVDIRRFPAEERLAINEEIARLSGKLAELDAKQKATGSSKGGEGNVK